MDNLSARTSIGVAQEWMQHPESDFVEASDLRSLDEQSRQPETHLRLWLAPAAHDETLPDSGRCEKAARSYFRLPPDPASPAE